MEDGIFPMVRLDDPTSMIKFLNKNQPTKLLDPSLGVTECAPRGMTMHHKVNVLTFLNICPKMAVLKKASSAILLSLLSSSSLPLNNG